MNHSRRHFVKGMALSGLAALSFSLLAVPVSAEKKKGKLKLARGSVILFQGDSITDGNRGRTEDPNHIMGHGYAFSIASRWGVEYVEKDLKFINKGIGGNKIVDLAARWQSDTLDLKPTILSILVGINDTNSVLENWEPVVSVEKYEETFRLLIEQTQKAYPDILLVFCEPFILPVGKVKKRWEDYVDDVSRRQAVVRKLALEQGAVFVGLQQVFNKACKKAPADYWMWDGIHPTVAGHELLAREWIKEVSKRIEW